MPRNYAFVGLALSSSRVWDFRSKVSGKPAWELAPSPAQCGWLTHRHRHAGARVSRTTCT